MSQVMIAGWTKIEVRGGGSGGGGMSTTSSSSSGISIIGLLGVVFVTLKLTGYIGWSWWWVTIPFWGSFVLFGIIFMFCLAMAYLTGQIK